MIRPWLPQDIPSILVIEEATQAAPWSMAVFEHCFVLEYLGWVLQQDDQIIGFLVASLQVGEGHILNVCVEPSYQGKGWGRKLLVHALDYLKKSGAGIAYLEVRSGNLNAIRLYQALGFSEIGQRKEYYVGPAGREDALVLAIDLMNMLE